MSIHEATFPDSLSYGSAMGPGFKTLITVVQSGQEQRVSRWGQAKRRYSLGYGIKSHADAAAVVKFAIMRNGAEHGFRLKDWSDYNSTQSGINAEHGGADPADDDQSIGFGDGTETQFQLSKTYIDSIGPNKSRSITKPRSGTVVVAVDGVAQTEGVDFTVNTATGIVTFGTPPGSGLEVTAGFEFDVPVRFTKSVDEWANISVDGWDNASAPSLEAVEILSEDQISSDFWYGGSKYLEMGANTQISVLQGRVKLVNATAASKKLVLPNTVGLPLGGPYFYIVGDTSTNAFSVVDDANNTIIASVTAGDIYEIVLLANSSGGVEWRAK